MRLASPLLVISVIAELLSKLRFSMQKNKKGHDKMIICIFGAITGGRLNLRAATDSSAAIIASIPNETLPMLTFITNRIISLAWLTMLVSR